MAGAKEEDWRSGVEFLCGCASDGGEGFAVAEVWEGGAAFKDEVPFAYLQVE